jgi:hypothetical protein
MNEWYSGTIEVALDEMVQCKSDLIRQQTGTPITSWIEKESDRLAPPNTMTQSAKRSMHSFYLSLLKMVSTGNN